MASEIKVDTISEKTSTNGVTIDSLSIKDGGLIAEGNIDVNGNNLVLDANANTYLDAGTDDTIKFYVAGAHDLTISANAINVLSGTTLTIDSGATITNSGTASGFGALAGIDDQTSSNDDQLTISDTAVILNEDSDDLDFRVESNSYTHMLTVDGSNNVVGVGIANAMPDLGVGLHIKTADSGATVSSNADELVIENGGGSASSGISILSATDGQGALYFGDSGDNDIGGMYYNHADNGMVMFGNAAAWKIVYSVNDVTFSGTGTSDGIVIDPGAADALSEIKLIGGEASCTTLTHRQDQNDDNADRWDVGQGGTNTSANTSIHWAQYSGGSLDAEMRIAQSGVLDVEGAVNASTSVDYAEYFEWKTELANDAAVTNSYGLTVVLDNDKVRLAEAGEEANILGVIRPNNVSAVVGGTQTFRWKDRYEKDIWGNIIKEQYTLVYWEEFNADGSVKTRHSYHKDRIPAKRLKRHLDESEHNWHTLASNLTEDDLVVPSTSEEKTAANYRERNTYRRKKGDHNIGDPLLRPVINASYDPELTYVPREKRRKEWCVVGLLGQVPIRDTAVIPTSWKKMKNLESGIDLYYIK